MTLCKIAGIFPTLCAFTLLLPLFLLIALKRQLQCVCIFFSTVSVTSHYNQLCKKKDFAFFSVIFLVYKTLLYIAGAQNILLNEIMDICQ